MAGQRWSSATRRPPSQADGPGPGRFHDQPNRQHRSRPAPLLHHRTSGRPLQARRHGGSLGPACKWPRAFRTTRWAAIGEQILAITDVSLSNWAPQRLQRGPGHPHRGRSTLEHRAHLQLDVRPRAPLRLRYWLCCQPDGWNGKHMAVNAAANRALAPEGSAAPIRDAGHPQWM